MQQEIRHNLTALWPHLDASRLFDGASREWTGHLALLCKELPDTTQSTTIAKSAVHVSLAHQAFKLVEAAKRRHDIPSTVIFRKGDFDQCTGLRYVTLFT